ncbi:BON domain-containing protein [Rubrobacter marinus]|uniref:BON domain-containing protein n=1 Tax=Rubrobacter marinus TaxID=2653852 RepID=UPI00140BAD2D|nr:BON domain-containing protein [Rubrobacter marinus]
MAKTTKAAGTLLGTRTGRKATAKAGKAASKAAAKSAKAQAKLAKRALSTSEPRGSRLLKYGLFALGGFAIGALLARAGGNQDASFTDGTGHHTPDADSPAGRRGETWGSGTPTGSTPGGAQGSAGPESGVAEPPLQKPEDPNRTGAEREYSDPSSGPLIGRSHDPERGDVPVQYEELENRIRTRIGEDPRTLGLQHLNVEVNDDVADIRGVAPSQEAKDAVSEIAADTPGVREVRNLMTLQA